MRKNRKNDDEEHQLGRVNLSGGENAENEVEIIENDESEYNDLSDDESLIDRNASRNRSAVRRSSSLQENRAQVGPPSRAANLSSSSFSRRFRRTSTSKSKNSTDLWKSRDGAGVDQSVNLMDLSQSNPGSASRARPGMSSLRQKSLVDIFLADEPSDSHHPGDDHLSSGANKKNRSLCNFVLIVSIFLVAILFIVVVPDFGLISKYKKAAPKATSKPTPSPTEAPQEELIEEEVELPPKQETKAPLVDSSALDLENVPKDSKLAALNYFLVDLDITKQSDLDTSGSAVRKASKWIAEKDPANMPLPGFSKVETSPLDALQAVLQRYALAVFYYSLEDVSTATDTRDAGRLLQDEKEDGDLANRKAFDQSWMSEQSICDWHGVVCDDDNQSVIQINLSSHHLQGTIPRELLVGEAMPYLKQLDLSKNQLQGTFPQVSQENEGASRLGDSPSGSLLEVLKLEDNLLSGSLDNLMGLTNLQELVLNENNFVGTIPADIAQFSSMHNLDLGNNHLTGSLPEEGLEALTALKFLKLQSNDFTGKLPETMHSLMHLQELILTGNQLSGSIPEIFGHLGNLKILFMDGNYLEGEVPTELGQLEVLEQFRLDGNDLTGAMPSEVCRLRDRKLSKLEADCASDQFTCDCCTECW